MYLPNDASFVFEDIRHFLPDLLTIPENAQRPVVIPPKAHGQYNCVRIKMPYNFVLAKKQSMEVNTGIIIRVPRGFVATVRNTTETHCCSIKTTTYTEGKSRLRVECSNPSRKKECFVSKLAPAAELFIETVENYQIRVKDIREKREKRKRKNQDGVYPQGLFTTCIIA